jgi:hypothetical protein
MGETQKREFIHSLKRLTHYFNNLKDIHSAVHSKILTDPDIVLPQGGADSDDEHYVDK